MNPYDVYAEIERVQIRLKSADRSRLDQELLRFVEPNLWQSILIYGGLYIRQSGSADVCGFFAQKSLEAVKTVCRRDIEAPVARRQTDQLLIAVAFLVFAFDNEELRTAVESSRQSIEKKIGRNGERFVDRVSLDSYLTALEIRLGEKQGIESLFIFFEALLRDADLGSSPQVEEQVIWLKRCLEQLIEEAGRRIEKPDRVISCADSLGSISYYAELLFDIGEDEQERFRRKYEWAYPRGHSFENINAFWTTCMVGLFALGQALDKLAASTQDSESDTDVPSFEAEDEERESRTSDSGVGPEIDQNSECPQSHLLLKSFDLEDCFSNLM